MTTLTEAQTPGGFRWKPLLLPIFNCFAVGLTAANVWPPLLVGLGMPGAALAEIVFLTLFILWASGRGWPRAWRDARSAAFRNIALSQSQWAWSIVCALAFAVTVNASLVVLFRLVPFPVAAFRQGYGIAPAMSLPLTWIAIVCAAASAGICEETGFRGYLQQPLERHYGAVSAILVSSLLFTVVHLSKAWAVPPMLPVVFGAGLLPGVIAWASNSLIPGFMAHTAMDTGLFAYWWTGTAGTFAAKTIAVTGIDVSFKVACVVATLALLATLAASVRLRTLR